MRSLKGKVLTGVVAVGLLSGVGMAFANTDAGTNLAKWYGVQFGKSADSVESQSLNYVKGQVPGLTAEYNGLKKDAADSIESTRNTETAGAQGAVTAAKDEHIAALNATQAELENYMQSQFDGITQAADTAIGQVGLQVQQYANDDLTKFTGKKGGAALTQVQTDLTASNKAAHDELQAAIENAKSDLQGELDGYTADSVTKIKADIDRKISELRDAITAKKNELVNAQEALIAAKALELENAAKADLDSVVAGI